MFLTRKVDVEWFVAFDGIRLQFASVTHEQTIPITVNVRKE